MATTIWGAAGIGATRRTWPNIGIATNSCGWTVLARSAHLVVVGGEAVLDRHRVGRGPWARRPAGGRGPSPAAAGRCRSPRGNGTRARPRHTFTALRGFVTLVAGASTAAWPSRPGPCGLSSTGEKAQDHLAGPLGIRRRRASLRRPDGSADSSAGGPAPGRYRGHDSRQGPGAFASGSRSGWWSSFEKVADLVETGAVRGEPGPAGVRDALGELALERAGPEQMTWDIFSATSVAIAFMYPSGV